MNDYKTNSLDSLTPPKTRANEPFKLGYLPPHNSLTHDYFANRPINSYPQVYFHSRRFIFDQMHLPVDNFKRVLTLPSRYCIRG